VESGNQQRYVETTQGQGLPVVDMYSWPFFPSLVFVFLFPFRAATIFRSESAGEKPKHMPAGPFRHRIVTVLY